MTKLKTINRGWLKKQIAAGRVEAKCLYHLTDDYQRDFETGAGRSNWKPATLDNQTEGKINFSSWELENKSGGAYTEEGSDLIHFYVHSNAAYEMRLLK